MAWTTPKTWAVADVLSAADLNAYVRDNTKWLGTDKPHARVRNSANISHTSSGSYQALTFNSERVDVGAMHDTVTNTSRLTVPSGGAGLFLIGGCIEFAANATGLRGVQIRLNGSTIIAIQEAPSVGAGSAHPIAVTTAYQLADGDYLELMGKQSSGGSLNMLATTNYSPEFWAVWQST